jgi:chromosome segregation ATPase
MSQSRRDFLLSKEEELRKLNEALEMQFSSAANVINSSNHLDLHPEDYLEEENPEDHGESEDKEDFNEDKQADLAEYGEYSDTRAELISQINELQSIIKFQKARIQALQEELNESMSTINDQAQTIENLKNFNSQASEDTKKHSQQLQLMSQNFEKIKKQFNEAVQKNNLLEKNNAELIKELESLRNVEKKAVKDASSRDVRLNRLIEEVERYKVQIKELKSNEGDVNERSKREVERLTQDNKRLERQKNEILTAYKKQLKLIDILKRQKMHLEGARLLAFSEEEFLKTLELGDKYY